MVARKTEILPPEFQEPETPPRALPQIVAEPDDPADVALANVLADLGGDVDAQVNVYIVEPGKGNAFCGRFDPHSFSIEAIQETFGPGEYRVHVRVDGRLVANRSVKIAKPRVIEAPPVSAARDEIGKLAETMQAGFMQLGQMMAQSVQAIASHQSPQKTTQELLQEMLTMKQLLEPAHVPQQGDQIGLFMKGIEFAKDITPREGEPGTGEVILEAIKNLGPAFMAAMQRPPQAPVPRQQQNPVSLPSRPSAPVRPESAPEAADMNMMRKMYLNMLIANAKANNDPSTYAAMALDLQGQAAVEFANNPSWFDLLCQEAPDAANYKEWFEEMRSIIIELTSEDKVDIQSDIETSVSSQDAIPGTQTGSQT